MSAAARRAPAARRSFTPRGTGCRILLVDDDAVALKVAALHLANEGFEVDAALGPEAGIARAKGGQQYDAVMTDVLMGDLDGFGLCRRLRDEPGFQTIPIILISAHFEGQEVRHLAARVGASALVQRTGACTDEIAALRRSLADNGPPVTETDETEIYEEHLRTNANQLLKLLRQAQNAEQKYRALIERMPDVVWTCDITGRLTYVSPNVSKVLGISAQEMCAGGITGCAAEIHPEDRAFVTESLRKLFTEGQTFDVQYRRKHRNGHWMWVRNRACGTYDQDGIRYAEGVLSDATEHMRLEQALCQAQKMDAIGQLTGGIAHDFNNMMAAILANCHFLLDALVPGDPRRDDADEIRSSAERAAGLTRQLLAFGRRQILEPRLMDLNSTVEGLEKMIQRLIREDIDFRFLPGAELGTVRADVGQIEQVIVNLVVNARDAMPNGGELLIETENVAVDAAFAARHVPMVPGRYVKLSIGDTGCGMDAETCRRAFEPFFTTKDKSKGTGLGLSTSYGIVKQSGGYIWVTTEPGQGTVLTIFLPRVEGTPEPKPQRSEQTSLDGNETILLVEDDDRVRDAIERMLSARGYQVVLASNGPEALARAADHPGPIHLVLSDVVMPGLSGPQVVKSVRARLPGTRALFMSGHADHGFADNLTSRDASFLQKPFAPDALAKKVRDTLDAGR